MELYLSIYFPYIPEILIYYFLLLIQFAMTFFCCCFKTVIYILLRHTKLDHNYPGYMLQRMTDNDYISLLTFEKWQRIWVINHNSQVFYVKDRFSNVEHVKTNIWYLNLKYRFCCFKRVNSWESVQNYN